MRYLVSLVAITLLFSACSSKNGSHGPLVKYETRVNATVGEDVGLPCIVLDNDTKVAQIEWTKTKGDKQEQILLYNPLYPFENKSQAMLSIIETNKELRGSILLLTDVTEENSGVYICDLATFPHGSTERFTHLQVTRPQKAVQVTVEVSSPPGTVWEGDEVEISCISDPPAQNYTLRGSQNRSFFLKNRIGKFILPKVNRHSSDEYICQPEWSSSSPFLEDHNATVQLTVNYLDEIQCNFNSSIEISAGQNLTILCSAISSQYLEYTWIKDNVTVSQGASLSLRSVSEEQTGVYTLTARSINQTDRRQQVEFTISVLKHARTQTTSLPLTVKDASTARATVSQTRQELMKTSPSETTVWPTAITMTTPELVRHDNFSSTVGDWNVSSMSPPVSNATVMFLNGTSPQPKVSTSDGDFLTGTTTSSSHQQRSNTTIVKIPKTTTSLNKSSSPAVDIQLTTAPAVSLGSDSSGGYVALIILPILILLLLAVLYRRHIVKKRMDMPPPFKPPPPPVKYTSVRSQEIPVTDII